MAKVFTEEEEWKDLRWKSLIDALRLKLIAEKKGPREAFDKYDLDKDGFLNKSELRSMFASLGATSSFSSGDLATIIEKCSVASNRRDQRVDFDGFVTVFAVPEVHAAGLADDLDNSPLAMPWACPNVPCIYMGVSNLNPPGCMECLQCGKINPALSGIMGDSIYGGNRIGSDQWSCPNCTFINDASSRYCYIENCRGARPM